MTNGTMRVEQILRDHRGRWLVSGNPGGRPRGAKNKQHRRADDPERAARWSRRDWGVFYRRMFREAEGDAGQKHAAAVSEAVALWLLLNPPPQRPGVCAQCAKPLDVPRSSIGDAPVRADGAWVHWGCLPWFLRDRWGATKAALQRLGIAVGEI